PQLRRRGGRAREDRGAAGGSAAVRADALMAAAAAARRESVVLHVGGLQYASERAVVERRLGAQPGVLSVDANPVAQTATVEYDPVRTNVATLKHCVEECGYHCAGRSVPGHLCDPLAEKEPLAPAHDHTALERADDADGHGHGGHAGMSMDAIV